jgi:predicted transcriptional regulator
MNGPTEMDDTEHTSGWSAEIDAALEEADAGDFASDEELAALLGKCLANGGVRG